MADRLNQLPLGLIGIGLGTVLPTTTVAIQNAVELHQLGTATGTMNFFRRLASAVTVAIFGALLNASGISEAALHGTASVPAGGFTPIFTATAIGFLIAFVEVGAVVLGFSRWGGAVVFSLLVIFLVFRPTGLLGSSTGDRA